jgi:hypothetical protein
MRKLKISDAAVRKVRCAITYNHGLNECSVRELQQYLTHVTGESYNNVTRQPLLAKIAELRQQQKA